MLQYMNNITMKILLHECFIRVFTIHGLIYDLNVLLEEVLLILILNAIPSILLSSIGYATLINLAVISFLIKNIVATYLYI